MTTESLKKYTLYFDSFETREQAFNQSVSRLIPCKYGGPQRFWREFNQIIQQRLPQLHQYNTAYITSNPRDCLAFGTTRQVLTAAGMLSNAKSHPTTDTVETIAQKYQLMGNLDQPIRTLSGGETVKLALAKARVMGTICKGLSIASPFCWLSRKNFFLLENVVDIYRNNELPVTIYALEGEDDSSEKINEHSAKWINAGPQFDLQTHDAQISLGSQIMEIGSRPQTAAVQDTHLTLTSPCLIQGENGQGKSLIAKALCNAVKSRGIIAINNQTGSARLLFQDVINQTLLRSFKTIAAPHVGARKHQPYDLYNNIKTIYKKICSPEPDSAGRNINSNSPTLLEIKMLLVAVRLSTPPSAVILDEPDWGLTRKSAEALVLAVVQCAHDLNVPVLIISHKPWWKKMIHSRLMVQKIPQSLGATVTCRFTILLKTVKRSPHAVEV